MINNMYNGYVNEPDFDEPEQEETESYEDKFADRLALIKAKAAENGKYFPICPFCGAQNLPLGHYDSQEAADEDARMHCTCFAAIGYQLEVKRKALRDQNIAKLQQAISDNAEYCAARNVSLDGDLRDYLIACGIAVIDGVIAATTVNCGKVKVNFKENAAGDIAIRFSYSDEQKQVVETSK